MFGRECFEHVAPAGAFGFVLLQPGAGKREARAFLAWQGQIVYASNVSWPTKPDELNAILKRMNDVQTLAAESPCDDHARLRMGLVARTLFDNPQRRGVVLRWNDNLTAETLATEIEAHRDELGLSSSVKQPGETKEATP